MVYTTICQLFMIWGMVYYCLTHISKIDTSYRLS